MASYIKYNKNRVQPMKSLIKSALILTLSVFISHSVTADANLDSLLDKIDTDIAAKRLSSPAGNNAIEKIWQFKAIAPYDQRINGRAHQVGQIYVSMANKAMAAKQYDKAQLSLDKVWMLSYLTPGLDAAQDALDKVYKSGGNKKTQVAKKKPAADNSKKQKQLAAAKLAKQKAEKQAAERRLKALKEERRKAEETERRLAQARKEEAAKLQAAKKLAALEAKRVKALAPVEVTSKAIADFNLDQELIDNRETREIRAALTPICKEIIDNEASVVLNTRSKQDYRWLTVRLTLCVRRIDKSFRLRHSFKEVQNGEPGISLHPGRERSLLQHSRG